MRPTASGWCFCHDPGREAERIAARRLGGLHRKRGQAADPPERVQLRSLDDLLGVLESAVADALVLDAGVARCRTVGYLAGQARQALELHHLDEIEQRLSALEQQRGIAA